MTKTILPYYKIQKTEEDKQFFFSYIGFFNFWNEYLVANVDLNEDIYWIIVNRTDKKFSKHYDVSENHKILFNIIFENSIRSRIPKEMFDDFPELEYIHLQ